MKIITIPEKPIFIVADKITYVEIDQTVKFPWKVLIHLDNSEIITLTYDSQEEAGNILMYIKEQLGIR